MEYLEINETRKRLDFLNIFKALLVFGMVTGHALMLLSNSSDNLSLYYKTYINLITFSGFLLAFGYLYEINYFQKKLKLAKSLKAVFKLLLAFYISGFFFRMLIKPNTISWPMVSKILVLKDIPGYSEFLLAFALISLFALFFAKLPDKLKNNSFLILSLTLIALLSTIFIKKGVRITYLGLLIGSHSFGAFPLLQYSFWFWLGVLLKRGFIKLNWKCSLFTFCMTLAFLVFYFKMLRFPNRFPPSFFWISGAAFPLYLLFILSCFIEKKRDIIPFFIYKVINQIGENTLFHLILSNLFLFVLSGYVKINSLWAFIMGCLVIVMNQYLISMIRK